MLHKDVPITGRHAPHSFEYANQAARVAATGFSAGDVGKLALQLDTKALWLLSNHSPTTWVGMGSGASPDWGDVQNKPATFPSDAHNHDGVYQPAGSYADATHNHDASYSALGHTHSYEAAGAVSTHEAALDPHAQYLTEAEADLLYKDINAAGGGGRHTLASSTTLEAPASNIEVTLDTAKEYLVEIHYQASGTADTCLYFSADGGSTWTAAVDGYVQMIRSSGGFNASWDSNPVIGSNAADRGLFTLEIRRASYGGTVRCTALEGRSSDNTTSFTNAFGEFKTTAMNRIRLAAYGLGSNRGFSAGTTIKVFEVS